MLLNLVIIKGINYRYLFFWGERGTLFIVHELWDDKTTGCNFWKPRWVFYCANTTHALQLCSDFIYKERAETFSLCL